MLSAIMASTGAGCRRTTPSAAPASVMLCASVNALTVAISIGRRSISSSSANR
jgi:hypothetical protein